jgi:hypothetical protein
LVDFGKFNELVEATIDLERSEGHEVYINAAYDESGELSKCHETIEEQVPFTPMMATYTHLLCCGDAHGSSPWRPRLMGVLDARFRILEVLLLEILPLLRCLWCGARACEPCHSHASAGTL